MGFPLVLQPLWHIFQNQLQLHLALTALLFYIDFHIPPLYLLDFFLGHQQMFAGHLPYC